MARRGLPSAAGHPGCPAQQPQSARALLEEALDLSLAARSITFVTLCLAGYAWLAFADGDPERAALLEGAAEGLRRRVGLGAWPPGRTYGGRRPTW